MSLLTGSGGQPPRAGRNSHILNKRHNKNILFPGTEKTYFPFVPKNRDGVDVPMSSSSGSSASTSESSTDEEASSTD